MKNILTKTFIASFALFAMSCGSGVTLEDVQKQESKAVSQLNDAQAELLELAAMKEQFSEDNRDAEIKAMRKRIKTIENDIGKLEDVKTSSAEGAAGSLASGLKDEKKKLENKIKQLESQPKENWTSARESINQQVQMLEEKANQITANLQNMESESTP